MSAPVRAGVSGAGSAGAGAAVDGAVDGAVDADVDAVPAVDAAVDAVPAAGAAVGIRTALWRRTLGELLGTGLLVAVVVGSGIAASNLSPDDVGLQLLENSLATALGLAVLIAVLGPLSGAHFNPVVTLVDWALGHRDPAGPRLGDVAAYLAAQLTGGIGGAVLANAMFGEPTAIATTDRASGATILAEVVATAGLVLVIFGLLRAGRDTLIAPAVGAYIGAAYWFTSSTSFANPAVTLGRVFSDTFAGIAPDSVLPFVLAQLVGGAVGVGLAVVLYPVRAAPARR